MACIGKDVSHFYISLHKFKSMADILELPDVLRNRDGFDLKDFPQLKYVLEMSSKLCPHLGFFWNTDPFFLQGGTLIFLQRYFAGSIDTSFKDAYLSNADLQNTLGFLGIDPSAFWYLILFLKDYVDDESSGQVIADCAYTELYNLAEKLYEMKFAIDPIDGGYLGSNDSGILKLKVGKHWIQDITNDRALFGLFCALRSFLRTNKPRREKALIDGVWEETNGWEIDVHNAHLFTLPHNYPSKSISIPETYKISYFATYMREFLEPFSKKSSDWRISTDRWLLTSRVIYIIGYSSDARYNTRKKSDGTTDLDFLKNNYTKDRYKERIRRTIYV